MTAGDFTENVAGKKLFYEYSVFNMTKIIFLLFVTLCHIQNLGGETVKKGEDIEGSDSIQGSFSVKTILHDLLHLPIKLPEIVLRVIFNFGRSILSLNQKALKIPISGIRTVISFVVTIFESIFSRIVNLIIKVHSINVDLVVGAIRKVQGMFAWIVNGIVNLNIFGLKTGSSIVGVISQTIDNLIGGILKFIVFILLQFNKIVQGGVKLFHIGDILKLPVVKQFVSLHSDIRKKVVRFIVLQYIEIGKFIDMIIYRNRDFFYPIFHKILNIFLGFTSLINQLGDDGGIDGGYAEIKEPPSGKWTAGNGYTGKDGSNSGSDLSNLGSQGSYPESWRGNSSGVDLSSLGEVELSSGNVASESSGLSSGAKINLADSASAIGISSGGDISTGNGGYSLKELLGGENWLDSGSSTESANATG